MAIDDHKIDKETKDVRTIVRIIVGLVAIFVTIYGFFIPQECGIDKDYLYCRLHPMKWYDFLGVFAFYYGAAFISGLLPEKLYFIENKGTAYNIFLGLIILAASFVLMWV